MALFNFIQQTNKYKIKCLLPICPVYCVCNLTLSYSLYVCTFLELQLFAVIYWKPLRHWMAFYVLMSLAGLVPSPPQWRGGPTTTAKWLLHYC